MPTRRTSRRDDDIVRVSDAEYSGSRRSAHLPEDENPFTFIVQKGDMKVGEESRKKYIEWQLVVAGGEFKGKRVYHVTSLQEKALFNLRGMMEAAGVAVKDARASAIIKTMTGKRFKANVMDDEYDGKTKSVLDDYVIESDDEDEDEDEEEEAPRRSRRSSRTSSGSKGRSRRSRDEEEDEEEEEEEEEEDEDEEDEDDEDEEDEEDEEPAPKRRAKSTATSAKSGRTRGKPSSNTRSSGRKGGGRRRDADEDLDEIDLDDL